MDHAIPIDLWLSPWVHREFVISDEPSICIDNVPYNANTLLLAALRDFWLPGHRCLIVDLGHDLHAHLRELMSNIHVLQVSECGWRSPDGGLLWLAETKRSPAIYDTFWDCIVVDHVDELGSKEIEHLVRRLRGNGRFRTARGATARTDALLGRKIRASGMADASIGEELRLRNIAFAAAVSYHSDGRWELYSSTVRERNILEAIAVLRDAGNHGPNVLGSAEEFAAYVSAFSDGFCLAHDDDGTFILITCDSSGCEDAAGSRVHDGDDVAKLLSAMRGNGWQIENPTVLGDGRVLCPSCASRSNAQEVRQDESK